MFELVECEAVVVADAVADAGKAEAEAIGESCDRDS
jgi:hypothetical protein